MPSDLSEQVALVTGGGRGIGRAMVEALSEAGAAVAVLSRTGPELEEVVRTIEGRGGRAIGMRVDVTDESAVHEAVARCEQQLGSISLLVNNAGTLNALGPLWESDPKGWWRDIETHIRGTFICSRAALAKMVPRRQGRIVNVVGMLGQRGEPYVSSYACAKAAVFRLTECLASELRQHGVSVFSVSPGLVRTKMTERLAESDEGARWAPDFGQVPEEHWLSSDLVGALVVRLADGEADQLTGRYLHAGHALSELRDVVEGNAMGDRLTMRVIR